MTNLAPDLVPSACETTPGTENEAAAFQPATGESLRWQVFRSTAGQITGRILIAATRLVSVAIIVRVYGKATFGEYSLIFGAIVIAEWLLDFGTSEIFVREICREPSRGRKLMNELTTAKMVQIPIAIATLLLVLLALRFPPRIVGAGMVGALSLVFYGGVLIYRVLFRATLGMERDVASEFVSALVMLPLVALAGWMRLGLVALVACNVVSRMAFFGQAYLFGRSKYRPSTAGVTLRETRGALVTAAPIGISGLIAVVYETIDILLLSRLATISDVAYYSGAQKFIAPVIMVQAAVGWTLYSMSASYWPRDKVSFTNAAQRGMESVMMISGFAVTFLIVASDRLVGLLGPELKPAAVTLRILALLCFAKAVSTTVGPLLYVVHAQKVALRFLSVALIIRMGLVAAIALSFGQHGVAIAATCVEFAVTIVTLILVRRYTGARLLWSVPLRIVGCVAVAAAATRFGVSNGYVAALIGPGLYVALLLATRALRPADFMMSLQRRPA